MPPPDIKLTYRDGGTGDAGDQYTGLDRFGRLVETLWKTGSTDQVQVRSKYGRNRFGGVVWRRDEEAHAQGKDTQDNYYGYDGLQQVKERQRGNLIGTAPAYTGIDNLQQEENWTHDATGNWTSYSNPSPGPADTQTRTHNTVNEIIEISASPGDVEPTYDPVGNMLTLPKDPGTSTEQYDLVWDAWNRLVAVKDGGTTVASYTYDGLTRRQTKTNAAETRHYYYNAQWRVVEERVEDASEPVDRQFTWGLRDRWDLLRRKRSVSGSLDETLYVLRDYLDPVAIVDETGAVVERYAYDAFGNVRFLAPDYSSKSGSDFDWDLLFHAEFRDAETTLYNYGYRYYDIGLGRWLSRDPIGEREGRNLYGFGDNNSMRYADALGLRIYVPGTNGNGFVAAVARALQSIVGKCATIRVVPHFKGFMDAKYLYRWEIVYSDGDFKPGKCNCNDCWLALKHVIDDNSNTVLINRTVETDTASGQSSGQPREVRINEDIASDPAANLPEIDPAGGPDIDAPARFNVVLWHEVIGHAGKGLDHVGEEYDSVIREENMARNCLRKQGIPVRDRRHGYY